MHPSWIFTIIWYLYSTYAMLKLCWNGWTNQTKLLSKLFIFHSNRRCIPLEYLPSFDISTSPSQRLNQLNKTIVKENIIHQPAQKTDDTLVRFRWDKKTTYRLRWHSFWHLCSKVLSALVIWFNIPIWNFHSWILQEPTHYRTGIFQCYDELNINLIFNVYIIFWG